MRCGTPPEVPDGPVQTLQRGCQIRRAPSEHRTPSSRQLDAGRLQRGLHRRARSPCVAQALENEVPHTWCILGCVSSGVIVSDASGTGGWGDGAEPVRRQHCSTSRRPMLLGCRDRTVRAGCGGRRWESRTARTWSSRRAASLMNVTAVWPASAARRSSDASRRHALLHHRRGRPALGWSETWNGFPHRAQALIIGRAPERVSTRPRCGDASAGAGRHGSLSDRCRCVARRRASAWVHRGRRRRERRPRGPECRAPGASLAVLAGPRSTVAPHLPNFAWPSCWPQTGAAGQAPGCPWSGVSSSQRPGCSRPFLSPFILFGLPCAVVQRSSSVTKGAVEGRSDQSVRLKRRTGEERAAVCAGDAISPDEIGPRMQEVYGSSTFGRM